MLSYNKIHNFTKVTEYQMPFGLLM